MSAATTPDPEPTDVPFVQPEGYGYVLFGTEAHEALEQFTLGDREVLCPLCWLIHRPGRCDL